MRVINLFFLVLCFLFSSISVLGQITLKGVVKDINAQPIIGASIIVRSVQDSIDYKGTITDANGRFIFEKIKSGQYHFEISFIGYMSYHRELVLNESVDIGEVMLEENVTQLDEVVVTAHMIERFADKKVYKLTNKEKEKYSSVLSALTCLPKIQVIDDQVNTANGKSVKILINGIPSTPADLSVISPENILKIDYYAQPPIQYSNMGLGAVINVIIKEQQHGGSIGINTKNALTTGFGNNMLNLKYNWNHSQFGISYNINYRNYNKRILDENIDYTISEKVFQKQKNGNNSPYAYEQQLAELNYNNSKPDNYLFSTKLSINTFNRRRSSSQNIISTVDTITLEKFGKSFDKDKYISPVIDLYFSKMFKLKHELILNLVGTYYKSDYDYKYFELYNSITDFETDMNINIDKYSLISEVMYNYKMPKGQLYIGNRYIYNNSIQSNLASNNQIATNEIYSYLGITGNLSQKISYNISASLNGNIFTTIEDKKYKFFYFRPQIRLGYLIDESTDVALNYEVNTENPAVSSLTYNPYYKDSNLLFVGNPNLKPSNNHDLSLSFNKTIKKFEINAEIGYAYTKDAIAPVFQSNESYLIETFDNLNSAQKVNASIFLRWSPFSNNIFHLWLYSEIFHQLNSFGISNWQYTGYSIIPSVQFSYNKWGVQLLYQAESKYLVGQTVKSRPSMAYIEISNQPIKNLTLTGGVRYPFYDAWKQLSFVSGTDLLQRTESERIFNNANMVYINFVYNFSFGKKSSNVKLKMQNKDKDSGILNRL